MRWSDFGLIFLFLFFIFSSLLDRKEEEIDSIAKLQNQYNHAVDSAVEDAMYYLCEMDSGRNIRINKEEAVERFLYYLSVGLSGNSEKILVNNIRQYVPVIAFIEKDGCCIYSGSPGSNLDSFILKSNFSDKIPYRLETEKYIYDFTMGNYVKIKSKNNNDWEEGDYHDLAEDYQDSLLVHPNDYDQIRRNTIITTLTESIIRTLKQVNKIASNHGITYRFSLPEIPKEDWYRTIDDISMLVFFQGYPYQGYEHILYNRYALGGARIRKIG